LEKEKELSKAVDDVRNEAKQKLQKQELDLEEIKRQL